MRVVLALTAICFALGMLQKGNCYEDAWRDGTARYTHMCYSDLPYMYTGRGFAELNWPYTDDAQVRARYDVMEYPAAIPLGLGDGLGHALAQRVARPVAAVRRVHGRALRRADVVRETRLYVAVNALGLAAVTLLAAWFLTGVNPRRPWTRRRSRCHRRSR